MGQADDEDTGRATSVLGYEAREPWPPREPLTYMASSVWAMLRRAVWMFGAAMLAGGIAFSGRNSDAVVAASIGAAVMAWIWPKKL